jgi:ADP-ribosylglycohydrolase
MKKGKSQLFEKVLGCLIGGLIGDAMGAPTEGMTYREIEKQLGEVNDFEGSGTDDSAIKLILCDAIIQSNGNVTADEFADSFLRHKDKYYKLFYIPVKNMFHKIETRLTLPVYAGLGNMHSSSSAMAISPMGLINACNPRQAALETYDVAGLIHAGVSTFCRDGACAMAASVAEAMKPDATTRSVVRAATAYLHKTSSVEMRDCIQQTLSIAESAGNYRAFREKFYETCLRDIVSDSRETVPCALALYYLAEGDPVIAIPYGANFGRDADTIGTMVGALSGAFKGSEGLKKEWVDKVLKQMPEQYTLAEKMAEIVLVKAAALKADVALLDQISN